MHMLRTTALALPLLFASGCGNSDLAQEWQLDRLRILAVRAVPAEPQPGDTVTFERLLYVPPETTLEAVTWFGCIPDGGIGFGCEIDPTILDSFADFDFASASPAELNELFTALQEAGFIGTEPGFPPTWEAPADALDGYTDAQKQEGVNAIINITAIPEGAADDDIELAYKRLPVSENDTPNHNPEVTTITMQGAGFVSGAGTEDDPYVLKPGGEVKLYPEVPDETYEEYTYVTTEGTVETRTEEPYWAWYTDGGEFAQSVSLPPYAYATYTAPKRSGWSGLIAVVMRDRRGGMGWAQVRATVE